MHTNQLLDSTQTKQQQICRKAGRGAGMLHAPQVGSYLPFLKHIYSLTGSYTTLEKTNGYTLSPAIAQKFGAIKRVSFTSNYLTLVFNLGILCYFKECLSLRLSFARVMLVVQCSEIQE